MESKINFKFLEGKSVDSESLVSMVLAQTENESKEVREFAEKVIDLVFSHSVKSKKKRKSKVRNHYVSSKSNNRK